MRNSEYYKKAYDEVHAPAALLGKVMNMKKERKEIKKKNTAKKWLTAAAAMALCFVASNGISYAATGETWVQKVTIYLNGEPVEQDVTFHQEGDMFIGEFELPDVEDPAYVVIENDGDTAGDVDISAYTQSNAFSQTVSDGINDIMNTDLVQENDRVYLIINGDKANRIDITEDFADGSATGTYTGLEGVSLRYTVTGNMEEYHTTLECE